MKKIWIAGGGAALAAGLAALTWVQVQASARDQRERSAAAALKTLAEAEADFRANDRDGNKVQDFWAGDVAGLYYLPERGTNNPIGLIAKDVADADAKSLRPGAPVPRDGYLFAVLIGDDHDDAGDYARDTEGESNAGPYYNHAKFGFCAYPADYPRSGIWTYVINEGNTIYKLDTAGQPVLRWPPPIPGMCRKCMEEEHPGAPCGVRHYRRD